MTYYFRYQATSFAAINSKYEIINTMNMTTKIIWNPHSSSLQIFCKSFSLIKRQPSIDTYSFHNFLTLTGLFCKRHLLVLNSFYHIPLENADPKKHIFTSNSVFFGTL